MCDTEKKDRGESSTRCPTATNKIKNKQKLVHRTQDSNQHKYDNGTNTDTTQTQTQTPNTDTKHKQVQTQKCRHQTQTGTDADADTCRYKYKVYVDHTNIDILFTLVLKFTLALNLSTSSSATEEFPLCAAMCSGVRSCYNTSTTCNSAFCWCCMKYLLSCCKNRFKKQKGWFKTTGLKICIRKYLIQKIKYKTNGFETLTTRAVDIHARTRTCTKVCFFVC